MLDLGEAADVRMASVIVACWPGPAVDLPTLPLRWGHTNIGAAVRRPSPGALTGVRERAKCGLMSVGQTPVRK